MVRSRLDARRVPFPAWAVWSILGVAALCAGGWLVLRVWLGLGLYSETIAAWGLQTTETRVPVSGGQLAARLFRRSDSTTEAAPAVVLVHGTSAQGSSLPLYRMLAHRLAARGAVVLLYDQRGYGASPDPARLPDGSYELPWIADARAAAAYLAAQPGVDARNVRLVGHSFGGNVAIGVSQLPGIECVLSRIVVVSPGRGLPYTGDERFTYRAERLSADMGLDPPLTPRDAHAIYQTMELESLLGGNETLDVALLHTSDEESRDALGTLVAQSNSTVDFQVLSDTDHYLGTKGRFNARSLPVKLYDVRPFQELITTILEPFAESSTDCSAKSPRDRLDLATRSATRVPGGRRISMQPGSRYLLARSGEPEVLIGDSITQAWMEIGTDFDYRSYLDTLAEHGLNATLLWAFIASSPSRRAADERIGYNAPALWPWCGSTAKRNFDLSCHNPAYFERLRDFVAYADQHGIVVVLTMHDGWTKDRFDAHPFSARLGNGPLSDRTQYVELARYGQELPETLNPRWDRTYRNQYFQERFCARLIEELQPFDNVVYEMFNEGEWYDPRLRRLHEQHFLRFFRARTSTPLASNADHVSGSDPRQDHRVDVVSLHKPQWSAETETRRIFEHYSTETRGADVKPVILTETVPAFTGDPGQLAPLTRVLWGTLLGGANVIVQDDVSFRFVRDSPMARYAAEGRALLERLGAATRLVRDLELAELHPDPTLCSSRICMALRGARYLAYADAEGEIWLDLTAVSGQPVVARWYDPKDGTATEPLQLTPRGRVVLQSPFADAVLYVSVRTQQL